MRRHLWILLLISMPACGSGDGGETMSMQNDTETELDPGPGSFESDFETSDEFVTRMTELAPGLASSPHMMVQIFYSKNIESVLGKEEFASVPVGTVAIKKQDRTDDGVVDQIMVMIKGAKDSDPDHADWSFEQWSPDGATLVTSSDADSDFLSFCSDCHKGYKKTDWLAGTGLEG